MGVSTKFFAVKLDDLTSLIGSNDENLRRPLERKVNRERKKKGKELVLYIDPKGLVKIQGTPQTKDHLAEELVRPKWAKYVLGLVFQTEKGTRARGGLWSMSPAQKRLDAFIRKLGVSKKFDIVCYRRNIWDGDNIEEFFAEEAALELLAGTATKKDCAAEYRSGLMLLVKATSSFLGSIEGTLEESLQWKTKLNEPRWPLKKIKLHHSNETPAVSYLNDVEVNSELSKLLKSNTVADEEWVNMARKEFLKVLKRASKENEAIVSFCE